VTRTEWLDTWKTQCEEWNAIATTMGERDATVTAYEVSLEQRKRALAEGRRLVTYDDLEKATG
jgi:hypothetical protein